jgi:hypothetical protein
MVNYKILTSGKTRKEKMELTHCQVSKETLANLKKLKLDPKEAIWNVINRLIQDKEELLYQIEYWRSEAQKRQVVINSYKNGIDQYLIKVAGES